MIGKKILFGAGIAFILGGIGAILSAVLSGQKDEDNTVLSFDDECDRLRFSIRRDKLDEEDQGLTDEDIQTMNDIAYHVEKSEAQATQKEISTPADFISKRRPSTEYHSAGTTTIEF